MGIPRRKSRRIHVDGKPYLWRLSRPHFDRDDDDWMLKPGEQTRAGHLTIQEDVERPGRPVQFLLVWGDLFPVTPEAVNVLIRQALASGWDPSSRGALLFLGDIDVRKLDTAPARELIIRKIMTG